MRKFLKNTFYCVLNIEVVKFFAVNFGFVIVYAFLGIKNHYGSSRVVVALLKFLLCYCLFCVKAVQR